MSRKKKKVDFETPDPPSVSLFGGSGGKEKLEDWTAKPTAALPEKEEKVAKPTAVEKSKAPSEGTGESN